MSGAVTKKVGLISSIISTAKPNLNTFIKYAKVELTPPKLSDLPEVKNEISKIIQTAKSGRWKNITVKDATINSLVAIEVLMWFYVGECIGKRHLIGYDIKL
ncbi:ATP synthase subunit g, mitochondrial-like [Sipha flava]|uniref:ATP synthase subunit g n=1 Tax=Sipha flava TaxID=143950 RepID=A0A8B8FXU5_9HEMI|nr:ATP synthase subunit g, mitochondrial-like [Sipha flava]